MPCAGHAAGTAPDAQSNEGDQAPWEGYMQTIEDMERRILALDPSLARLNLGDGAAEPVSPGPAGHGHAGNAAASAPLQRATPQVASTAACEEPRNDPGSRGACGHEVPLQGGAGSQCAIATPGHSPAGAAKQRMHALGDDRTLSLGIIVDSRSPRIGAYRSVSPARPGGPADSTTEGLTPPLIELDLT